MSRRPTAAQVEAAARVLAHAEEFNAERWPKYARIAQWALEAAFALPEQVR